MSDTIVARQYAAQQAAMLQRRPAEVIEAAESTNLLTRAYLPTLHLRPENYNFHGANSNRVFFRGAGEGSTTGLAAGTSVVVVCTSRSTTSLELVDQNEYRSENIWIRWADQAKKALQKAASTARRQTTAGASWRVERLSALQATFSFTIQDLAAVLGVARPQLYKWMDAAQDIKLQEASRERLALVERMAKEWTVRSQAPLSSVSKEPLHHGGNVFAMLSANVIDEGAVVVAFDELVAKLHEQPRSRSQRLREVGFTRRPSVRSLPSDE